MHGSNLSGKLIQHTHPSLLFKGVLGDKSCIKREKEEAHPCKAFLIKKSYPYEQCSSFSGRQFPDPVVRLEN